MRFIQAVLDDNEFLRAKALAIVQGRTLKTMVREAIVAYLDKQQSIKGESKNGQETFKEN